jgi:hypothetical protein
MTQPSAAVIADSISPTGQRVTTMVVTMHRFVLAEFNTHRVFSRNSASSRAIPVQRQLDRAITDRAFPLVWPREQPGMSGGGDLDGKELRDAQRALEDIWHHTTSVIQNYLSAHPDAGGRLHKSILNRPMEWFMWHTVVVTSTDWSNFFNLRVHLKAQPEIRAAAQCMKVALDMSTPTELDYGMWHTPFTDEHVARKSTELPGDRALEYALKTSAARCAWVSTMKHGEDHTYDDVERIYDILTEGLKTGEPVHASPFEHQCTPISAGIAGLYGSEQAPGNLKGWAQLRHLIESGKEPWS